MELEGLDDILKGEAEAEPIAEPKSDLHEASPIVDRPRDEHGRFAKEKGDLPSGDEPPEAAPPAAQQEPDHVPRAALQDERRKRQELEARLQQMEQQFRQPPVQQPEAPVDFWEDPNAVISNQVSQAVSTALQQYEQQQAQRKADVAERAARAKYPDYDDAFAKFREQVQLNPSLLGDLHAAENPAEFAYNRGKQALEIASVGSLDDLKARIRAEVEAELRAAAPLSPTLPTTTAGQRSVGDRGGPAWGGPPSLSEILS